MATFAMRSPISGDKVAPPHKTTIEFLHESNDALHDAQLPHAQDTSDKNGQIQ